MACPTCGNEMKRIALAQYVASYWCSRCGTIYQSDEYQADGVCKATVPQLVERARELEELFSVYAPGYRNTDLNISVRNATTKGGE